MIQRITAALAALALFFAAPVALAQGTNDPAGEHSILKAWGYATTPVQLQCYANGSEPTAPAPLLGHIACSSTDTAPRFYTGAAWLSVALSGGAGVFSTVSAGDAPITTATVDAVALDAIMGVGDDATTTQLDLYAHRSTGAVAGVSGRLEFLKARGTNAAQTVIVTGDQLGEISVGGHDGTDFASSSAILFESEGVIAADQVPGLIRTFTADAAGTLTERIRTDSAGLTTFGLDGVANAQTVGVSLFNDDPAVAGGAAANQEYSPLFELRGSGWEVGTGTSMETAWGLQTRPIHSAGAAPTSALDFMSSIDGAAYASRMNLASNGALTLSSSVFLPFNASISSTAATLYGAFMPWNGYQATGTNGAYLATGSTSNTILIGEFSDVVFDRARAQETNPTLAIYSANASTAEWLSLAHDQTNGVISTGLGGLAINDDGAKGVATVIQTQTESVTFAGGGGDASKITTGSVIPAGAFVVGVSTRVTTADSGAAVSMNIGIAGTDDDAFAVGTSLAEGDKTTSADGSGDWSGVLLIQPNFSAQEITVTPNVAAIDMVVAISVHYIDVIAATTN